MVAIVVARSAKNMEIVYRVSHKSFLQINNTLCLLVSEEKIKKNSANQKQELPMLCQTGCIWKIKSVLTWIEQWCIIRLNRFRPFGLFTLKAFKIIWLTSLSTLSVPDEGFSWNVTIFVIYVFIANNTFPNGSFCSLIGESIKDRDWVAQTLIWIYMSTKA